MAAVLSPELLARAAARCSLEAKRMFYPERFTLEAAFTSPLFVSPGMPRASAPQRALCRVAMGLPVDDLLTPQQQVFHFGAEMTEAFEPPVTVILRTGVRAGKSLLAACGLIRSILTCSFRRPPEEGEEDSAGADGLIGVMPGELVRAVIVAPKLALSRSVFHHLVGVMRGSRYLAPMLSHVTKESCIITRPDGNPVTVELVAASAGGTSLRSTWLAGFVLDECDFHDAEDAAVNLGDNYRAGITRLLRGAQAWLPSSPWSDEGEFHKMFSAAFGTREDGIVAFHSNTRAMNPTLDVRAEALERKRDPENAAREFDAIPLKSGSKRFFPEEHIARSVMKGRELPLPPTLDAPHYAGTDLGFRKNSSALAIARAAGRKVQLALTEELRPDPDMPLVPGDVCAGFVALCQRYSVGSVRGDQWYADSAKEHFSKAEGPAVSYDEWNPTGDLWAAAFTVVRSLMAEGRLELPDDPRLLHQMRGVTSKPMPGGKIGIVFPKQGAAHADLLQAVVLAIVQVVDGETFGQYEEGYDAYIPTTLRD